MKNLRKQMEKDVLKANGIQKQTLDKHSFVDFLQVSLDKFSVD